MKKITKKKNNSTTQDSPIEKRGRKYTRWLEEYTSIYGEKNIPVTESFMENIAKEYVTWIQNNPQVYRFGSFWIHKAIPISTAEEWVVRYHSLIVAHRAVLDILADRRESAAIKFNPTSGLRMLPMYDKNWKAMEEWRSKLKQENQQAAKTVIVMDKFEYESKSQEGE